MECEEHRTTCLIAHVSKIIESKSNQSSSQTLGLDSEEVVEPWKHYSERRVDRYNELFVFVDFKKAFIRVIWVQLLDIKNGVDRCLISRVDMEQDAVDSGKNGIGSWK